MVTPAAEPMVSVPSKNTEEQSASTFKTAGVGLVHDKDTLESGKRKPSEAIKERCKGERTTVSLNTAVLMTGSQ